MPPLSRQDTPASVFSWWTDPNSLLENLMVNLHMTAKWLMMSIYHHQALKFIKKNRGTQLSTQMVETYLSYFP
jgi:hypothetical protein